jgi:hypothetical protein
VRNSWKFVLVNKNSVFGATNILNKSENECFSECFIVGTKWNCFDCALFSFIFERHFHSHSRMYTMSLRNVVLLNQWNCRFVRLNSVLFNSTGSRIKTLAWLSSISKLHPQIQFLASSRSYYAHIPKEQRKNILKTWLQAPFASKVKVIFSI